MCSLRLVSCIPWFAPVLSGYLFVWIDLRRKYDKKCGDYHYSFVLANDSTMVTSGGYYKGLRKNTCMEEICSCDFRAKHDIIIKKRKGDWCEKDTCEILCWT